MNEKTSSRIALNKITGALIWFIASIFHAKLFDKTRELRVNNKKDYTLPAIIDQLDMIPADKNLTTD